MCFITVDRTGFPLLRVPRLGLDVHLFPVLKVQFEAFLAEQNEFGDSWYAEVLSHSPRCSWRHTDRHTFERQFLTAIWPEEALKFAEWLGTRFRLLTVDERQRIQRIWMNTPATKVIKMVLDNVLDDVAKTHIEIVVQDQPTSTLADLSLSVGGIMEWASGKRDYALLGQPRESIAEQLFDWRTPVRPTSTCGRNLLFGFRLASQVDGP